MCPTHSFVMFISLSFPLSLSDSFEMKAFSMATSSQPNVPMAPLGPLAPLGQTWTDFIVFPPPAAAAIFGPSTNLELTVSV